MAASGSDRLTDAAVLELRDEVQLGAECSALAPQAQPRHVQQVLCAGHRTILR